MTSSLVDTVERAGGAEERATGPMRDGPTSEKGQSQRAAWRVRLRLRAGGDWISNSLCVIP